MQYWGYTYTKKVFVVDLKCKGNPVSSIFAGSPTPHFPLLSIVLVQAQDGVWGPKSHLFLL